MLETHPFGNFVPPKCQYLLLGGFAARPVKGYDWFYANKRNQFWSILQEVYGVELDTTTVQQELFTRIGMGISDIILSCERIKQNNSDTNLTNFVINSVAISKVLGENEIKKIFFSSRFAETLYKRHLKDLVVQYPKIQLVTLPSPSPRYAAMSKADKIVRYTGLLPALK